MGARDGDEVGDQAGRDRLAGLDLFVLPGVAEVRHDQGDAAGGRPAEGVHQDQQLHQGLVDGGAGGLDDEHIHAAHTLVNLDLHFAVGEAGDVQVADRQVQVLGDLVRQFRVGVAAEDA